VEKENDKEKLYPLQDPDPVDLPEPTLWPIALAFGILFLFWGFISSLGLSILGALVMVVSIAGWISDLKPE